MEEFKPRTFVAVLDPNSSHFKKVGMIFLSMSNELHLVFDIKGEDRIIINPDKVEPVDDSIVYLKGETVVVKSKYDENKKFEDSYPFYFTDDMIKECGGKSYIVDDVFLQRWEEKEYVGYKLKSNNDRADEYHWHVSMFKDFKANGTSIVPKEDNDISSVYNTIKQSINNNIKLNFKL